jgi:hypothetical protein
MTPPAPYEKSKFLGSGGSMVARLKLKGIDGRAPPGVKFALAPVKTFQVFASRFATIGDIVKLLERPKAVWYQAWLGNEPVAEVARPRVR